MDNYESTDARFAEIRAAREQRRAQRRPSAGADRYRDSYDTPPYDNFPMEDALETPPGSLVRVVVTQAVVCALLLGCLIGARQAMPNTYRQLRAAYTRVMQTDMSVKEVWAAAKAVFASLKEDIYVMVPYREAEAHTEEPTKGAAGGIDVALEYAGQSCSIAPIATTARPYPPVGTGNLSSAFGYRIHPISGEEGVHTGMDIAAPEGDPISAAFFGTVLETGENKGYGKYVLMEHAGGLRTLYAHCLEIIAEKDMVLRPGDVIAYVGSTGNSTGPHLHFEVRLNGLRCNPAPLFWEGMYPPKEEE